MWFNSLLREPKILFTAIYNNRFLGLLTRKPIDDSLIVPAVLLTYTACRENPAKNPSLDELRRRLKKILSYLQQILTFSIGLV
jgi:hypothetical protein